MAGTPGMLKAAIIKETRVLLRDREALMVLFAMPLAFVLIMSLAMQDVFKEKGGASFSIAVLDRDGGKVGQEIIKALTSSPGFNVDPIKGEQGPSGDAREAALRKDVSSGKYKFGVIIPENASKDASKRLKKQLGMSLKDATAPVAIRLYADPTIRSDYRKIISTTLNRVLQGIETGVLLDDFAEIAKSMGLEPPSGKKGNGIVRAFDEVSAEQANGKVEMVLTAVQQNVPAWSLFAMFFLVIPLSVTFVKERAQGSLTRLRAMPAPAWVHMCGKIAPYFVINQLQISLMLLVGVYVMPLLGGDELVMGHSPLGIAILTASASLAAIGYGLLIAVFCRTTEQATTFGGTSVIIFAAIGGIMVPKFVMPAFMQKLAVISPMNWGLEGFFDIFVRSAGVREILPRAGMLAAFAAVCMIVAVARYNFMVKRG